MIKFSNVSFIHPGGTKALENINVEFKPGDVTVIVGANGAGKTTLIRHINGLLKPTQGNVTVFGINTKKASVAQLSRRVGVVFQNPNHQLFSDTTEHEIEFALRNFGLSDEIILKRTKWALEFFDLADYAQTSPMMLSGGEKKRLCLAAVLAWEPDVLVLDEPTVGQDLIHKEKLEQIIRLLLTEKKTVIIVSHDIEFIWPIQPRIIVMTDGDIIADRKAADIFEDGNIISKARLVKPQLVEFGKELKIQPQKPFSNINAAKEWVLSRVK